MTVTFVLEDAPESGNRLARHEMDAAPLVDEIIEIKGVDYVVRSRRWKSTRLGVMLTIVVRAVIETTV